MTTSIMRPVVSIEVFSTPTLTANSYKLVTILPNWRLPWFYWPHRNKKTHFNSQILFYNNFGFANCSSNTWYQQSPLPLFLSDNTRIADSAPADYLILYYTPPAVTSPTNTWYQWQIHTLIFHVDGCADNIILQSPTYYAVLLTGNGKTPQLFYKYFLQIILAKTQKYNNNSRRQTSDAAAAAAAAAISPAHCNPH